MNLLWPIFPLLALSLGQADLKTKDSVGVFSFTQLHYNISIDENVRGKQFAIPDLQQKKMGVFLPTPDGTVKFKIVQGDENDFFTATSTLIGNFVFLRIRTQGGLNMALNRELKQEYLLLVKATFKRKHSGNLETRTEIRVRINDRNDLAPIFRPHEYKADVLEDVPLLTEVIRVTASDPDEHLNGEVFYSLKEPSEYFSVHPATGAILTIRPFTSSLEREHTLIVQAVDRASLVFPVPPGFFRRPPNTAKVVIRILSSNLHSPTIRLSGPQIAVRRDVREVQTIATFEISDEDTGQAGNINEVALGHITKECDGFFTLDSDGGTDYFLKTVPGYSFPADLTKCKISVEVLDDGSPQKSSTKELTVEIRSRESPTLAFKKYSLEYAINESTPIGSLIGYAELESESPDNCTFELLSDSPELPFAINPIDGVINVSRPLDFEAMQEYSCKIRVASTTQSAALPVTFKVLDSNDNDPLFTLKSQNQEIQIDQDTALETVVGRVRAEDVDTGSSGKISYKISNSERTPFLIDPISGAIKLRSLLKDSSSTAWNLRIRATDWGQPLRREAETDVVICIIGKKCDQPRNKSENLPIRNVAPPIFEKQTYAGIVKEDAPVGSSILTVSAKDKDHGYNGVVQYILSDEGNYNHHFTVHPMSGEVKVFKSLHDIEENEFNLRVIAIDMGAPSNSAEAFVRITISDVNNNPPVFARPLYSAEIQEDTAVGTKIIQIEADDLDYDDNGKIRYTLLTKTDDFELDSKGFLSVLTSLDRERISEYLLTVQASDSGSPPLSATTEILVTLTDVNDNPPRCSNKLQKIQITEDWPLNTLVTCVEAADPDIGSNGRIRYSLEKSLKNGKPEVGLPFRMTASTGCVTLTGPLDFEQRPLYNLTVEVSDGGRPQYSSLCNILIELIDVDENISPPKLTSFAFDFSVYENEEIGTKVGVIQAEDPDETYSQLEYSFGYDDGSDSGGLFTIDRNGVIRTAVSLDREKKSEYWLRVIVSDTAPIPKRTAVDVFVRVLDRNDHFPFASQPMYFAQVPENSPPGTLVTMVDATDSDETTGDGLEYRISRGDPQSFFEVDPNTGYIKTYQRKLDREAQAEQELEIAISDRGETRHTSLVKVVIRVQDVNDNAPKFLRQIYNFNVPSVVESGELLGRVIASDEDEGENANLMYAITEGASLPIRIRPQTGELFAKGQLPQESKLELTVEARDGSTDSAKTAQTRVIINVLKTVLKAPEQNKPPVIKNQDPLVITVAETEEIGPIELVEAEDPDGDRLWFEITGGNVGKIFSLRKDTGELQLAQKLTDTSEQLYFLTYTVSDLLSSVEGSIEISIRRERHVRPAFDHLEYHVNISESTDPGTRFLSLGNTDIVSVGESNNEVAPVTYFIHGSQQEESKDLFKIDPERGDLVLVERLDHESTELHGLVIGARRKHLANFTNVFIRVTDSNDFAPRFISKEFEAHVLENAPIGYEFLHMKALDQDSGRNGEVSYTIVSGNDNGFWELDAFSGHLRVATNLSLDFPEALMVVKVTDMGSPPLTDIATVRVVVDVSGESLPRFTQETYLVSVRENLRPGFYIMTVHAECLSPVLYEFAEPQPVGVDIQAVSGIIHLTKPLDFERNPFLNFTVLANTEAGITGRAGVRLAVEDVNDHHPVFTESVYEGSVQENMPSGSVVMSVAGKNAPLVLSATDKDTGVNAMMTYEIVDHWATEYFAVDYGTGALRTRKPLDFEKTKSFNFRVQASDMGSPSLTSFVPASVRVEVIDMNDVAPKFTARSYAVTLYLPTCPGAEVLTVSAKDSDTVGDLVYSVSGSTAEWDQSNFVVGKRDGRIEVATTEGLGEGVIEMEITASDGILTDAATVRISVTSLENVPQSTLGFRFLESSYSVTVLENSTRSSIDSLLVLNTIGTKLGEHTSFTLLNPNPWFELNKDTGELSTTGVPIDREVTPQVFMVAEASDYRNPSRIARTTIMASVQDINDNSPRFVNQPYFAIITSESEIGRNVTTVQAIDVDDGRNGQIRYELEGNPSQLEHFSVHPITGVITLKTLFKTDFRMREFIFKVKATDQGNPSLSDFAELRVKVVHKAMPVFEKPFYALEVEEDSAPGNQLLVIRAHSNESGTIAYAVVDGDSEGAFDIHYSEGVLTLERGLDRERISAYNLTIRALDISRSDIYSDVSVAIQVTDINDNSPVFWNNSYMGQFSEATPIGAELMVMSANDIDQGKNAEVFFSLRGPDAESFEIAEESGILYLRNMLNFEEQRSYEFTAVAEDSGVPRRSSTCNVRIEVLDVNDEPPSFTDPIYQAFLAEDASPGHFITAVLARDPDTVVSAGLSGLMYSVLDGDDTPPLFALDSTSGVLRTKRTLPDNIESFYQLNISATDGAFSSYSTLNINITESPNRFEHPHFTKNAFTVSIMENGISGSEILALEAVKGLKPLQYSFVGEGDLRPFRIEPKKGRVILLEPLDYEKQVEYRYSIAVEDKLGRRGFSNLLINVLDQNDNSPEFVANKYKAILPSNVTRGQKVFQFLAQDRDTGDSVEYSMYKDPSFDQPDVWTYFKLHRKKGKLSVKRSLLKLEGKEFRFFVRATDRGNPPSQTEVPASIVVGEQGQRKLRWKRDEYSYSVREDAPIGSFVPTVSSNRAALRQIPRGTKFSIIGRKNEASLPFAVNRETGILRVIKQLDRESASDYSIVLQAESFQGSKVASIALCTVHISVDDVNDNKPKFDGSYRSIEISEDAPVGSSVTIISATDEDAGSAGSVIFSLQGQEAFGVFDIDPESGWLRLTGPLDRELKSTYKFAVVASDKGTVPNPLHSETVIEISVKDVNDEGPIFLGETQELTVPENSRVGTIIGSVQVKDDDLFPNNQSRLSIIEGDSAGCFGIKDTGEIYLMKNVDFEQQNIFSLTILAWDGVHSSSSSVIINVEDVNDHAPMCEVQHATLRLSEDTSIGTEVFTVVADDMDTGVNAEFVYHLNGKFSNDFIVRKSGALVVAKPLDREVTESYELDIQVEDRGGLSCNVKLDVVISDVNDNPPSFEKSIFTARVTENLPEGAHFVTRIRAMDPDLGLSGRLQYALQNTDLDDTFWVDEISGAVTVQKPLDRENVPVYNLTIIATDQGVERQLSSTTLLTVAVDDVNDHPPEFVRKEWEVKVSEQEQTGLELVQLEAFSADLNDSVHYHIVAPASALDFFSINKKTGQLSLKHPLDFETQQRHVLTIEAVDAGDPPLSARAVVTVEVTDENDNQPQFTKRLFKEKIAEDAAPGSRIAKLSADDLDSGDNAVITYRLAPEHQNLTFFNVSTDGWITVTAPLDFETQEKYRFLVEAWDSGAKRALSDTTVVEVHITDVNDNPPVFADCNLSADIKEGIDGGRSLLSLVVSDKDGEGNGAPFAFSVTGPGSEKFRITLDGDLRTDTKLVYSDNPTYLLMVSAEDSGSPSLSSECPLTVRVLEESKFPPTLEPINVLVKSYLGEFPGGQLAVAQAQDKDEMDTLVYGLAASDDYASLSPFLDMDPESGVITAGKGLPIGNYHLNVSVTDGKFKTYAPLVLQMEMIGDDELGFAISVRVRGITAVSFIEDYEKKFRKTIAKLLSARPRAVKLLSVQEVPQSFKTYRKKRATNLPDLDVLFAVKKGRNAFFRPEFIRQSLEGKNDELSDRLNLDVAGLVTEVCRRDSCVHGQCRDRLWMDDTSVLSISGRRASFVAPRHKREFQCVCSEGYGGRRCDIAINACSRNNTCESRWSLCIPRETPVGYSCACLPGTAGPGCTPEACSVTQCTNDNLMSMVGKSYARYTLSSPLTSRLQLKLQFRTTAPNGILMHGAGKADYHVLEVKEGKMQYRFNCGSGEGKVSVRSLVVSDGAWHTVSVVRRGRFATLSVDRESAEGLAPGSNAKLNLNSNDLTFGAEVKPHPTLMGREQLFDGFTGCIRRIKVDEFDLPLSKTGTKLYNVEFNCPESFIAGVCSSAPCQNGGKCEVESMSEYRCVCPSRFTGVNCETDLNPCQSQPCPAAATCQNLFNDYFCLCPPGLTHKKCLTEGTMNPCASSPCNNNGQCHRMGRGFQCNCTSNWSGKYCSTWIPPNIEGNELGITIPEIIGIVVVLLVLIALTCLIVICCRRQGRNGYKKARYLQTQANNEIMLDHATAHIRNQLVTSELSQRTPELPPPLPPRHRGFHPHRNSKLSNLESAQLTGLPTVQVRPLSFSDNREETPGGSLERERWEDEMATCAFGRRRGQAATGNLENARNYGSAAEELEKLSRYSNDLFQNIKKPGKPDMERNLGHYDEDSNHNKESIDWREHLDLLSVDSIERIKAEARSTDEPRDRLRSSESDPMVTARSMASIQCLPEDENPELPGKSKEFQWDYTDWNSTMNRPVGPHTNSRHSGDFTEDDDGASLPEGVSGVEDIEMIDETTPLEIPELPPTPDFKRQLLALQEMASGSKGKTSSEVASPRKQKKPVEEEPEDEYVTMKPLSSYQRHLDKYLPKHRPPPDSTQSQRKPLLGSSVERELGGLHPSSESEEDPSGRGSNAVLKYGFPKHSSKVTDHLHLHTYDIPPLSSRRSRGGSLDVGRPDSMQGSVEGKLTQALSVQSGLSGVCDIEDSEYPDTDEDDAVGSSEALRNAAQRQTEV